MCRKVITLFIILFLCSSINAQDKYTGQSIEQIFVLPEEEIDIGLASLVIAKEAYPDMNIEFFDYALDYMVDNIRIMNQDNEDPEARIALLNYYLFVPGQWNDSLTFTFDFNDMLGRKTENQYLNGLIATPKGNCLTIPLLYLAIADRLDWPIYAVRAPQHFFCRYIVDSESNEYYNIETTAKGMISEDQYYIDEMRISEAGLKNGCYMRTLSEKEYLASLLHNHVQLFWTEKGVDLKNSFRCLDLAIQYDSLNCEAYWHLGNTHFIKARNYERLMNLEKNQLAYSPEALVTNNPATLINIPKTSSVIGFQKQPGAIPSNPFGYVDDVVPRQNNQAPIRSSNIQKDNSKQIKLNMELAEIENEYIPLIKEHLKKSEYYIEKAKNMGMVFETTQEFYQRQADKQLEYDLKNNK